ncbi:hypothetical protein IWX81_000061 [Salinibacterium sp. CAN_S4]|uniref:hypothetical protein n=1 Tax=Salinibacterium sp. CAN_S4 TaxID=2787727 RepID=UPI0018F021CF
MTLITRIAILPVLAIALSIVGCAEAGPEAIPIPTPSAVETKAPQPEPEPEPEPTIERVTVLADSITVTDSEGNVVDAVDFFTPPDEIIRVLTNAFGVSPETVREGPCNCDRSSDTAHNWDGFVLFDATTFGRSGDQPGVRPYDTVAGVSITAASVNGVQVDTVDGVMVGDDAAPLAANYPIITRPNYLNPDQPDESQVSFGTVPLPDDSYNTGLSFSVHAFWTSGEGVITRITTPINNNFGL